ncbi:MAG: hypothetical protein ACK52I_24800 [Pseudomonadota bacterium]|jgi:hypothetical protein
MGDSDERSVTLHLTATEADQKLDHFIVGVALALAAYLGRDMRKPDVVTEAWLIESLAMVAFAAAAYCGIQRLVYVISAVKQNARYLHEYENARVLNRTLADPVAIDAATGDLVTVETRRQKAAERRHLGALHQVEASRQGRIAERYYKARDYFLYGGLVLLAFGRFFT